MRSILLHCKNFKSSIVGLSTRGVKVAPEKIKSTNFNNENCIAVFITVEKNDSIENIVPKISEEILKFCNETKENNVTLCPFAHLSNNLASFNTGLDFFDKLEKELIKKEVKLIRVHFGSDKDLLLDIFGHPGNIRYREF